MEFTCEKCGATFKSQSILNIHKKACQNSAASAAPEQQQVNSPNSDQSKTDGNSPNAFANNFAAVKSSATKLQQQPAAPGSITNHKFSVPGPNKRVCAYFVDMILFGLCVYLPGITGVINGILQTIYILLKDTNNAQSIGKKAVGLVILDDSGAPASKQQVILRNSTLAVVPFCSVLSIILDISAFNVAGLIILAEYFIFTRNPEGKRMGDQIAGTRVNDLKPEENDSKYFLISVGFLIVYIFCIVIFGYNMDRHGFGDKTYNYSSNIQWKAFKPAGGDFEAMFPAEPKLTTNAINEVPGADMKIYSAASAIASYNVGVTTFPKNEKIKAAFNNPEFLEMSLKLFIQGKLIYKNHIKNEKFPGIEYKSELRASTVEIGKLYIKASNYKVFMVLVETSPKHENSAELKNFFNSFKIK